MILGPVHYRVDMWFEYARGTAGDWRVVARTPDREQGAKLYEKMAAKRQRVRFVEVRENIIVEMP